MFLFAANNFVSNAIPNLGLDFLYHNFECNYFQFVLYIYIFMIVMKGSIKFSEFSHSGDVMLLGIERVPE